MVLQLLFDMNTPYFKGITRYCNCIAYNCNDY